MALLGHPDGDYPPDPHTPPGTASPAARAHLLNDRTTRTYQRVVTEGVERVAHRFASVTHPATGASVAEVAAEFADVDLDRPLHDSRRALEELERLYLRDAVYFHHPRYLAHLNCPIVIPAVLGEAVLSAVNSSLDTWDQSTGATLIERQLVEWTARRIGLGPNPDGVFTSGGTQSNLQALLLARDEACAGVRRHTPSLPRTSEILPRLRVLTSECAHFSVAKSAALLGLGYDAVVPVPTDADKRMLPEGLAAELERCHRDGLVPMAVVATAGTTDFGSIDPLEEVADLCRRFGAWLHVDAAYGCGLLVSRRRHLLDGAERADSVTVDFHKSFFQPVSSSAVLVGDRATLRHATYHADYLNPEDTADRVPNQVDKSIQTTRRFDALKLWLTLRVMGAGAVGELFDAVVDRADEAWTMIEDDPRFEIVTRPQLSTLVFRYLPRADATPELCDRVNRRARQTLFESGLAVVAATTVAGRQYLKFTLLNPETSTHDITAVLELIAEHAALAESEELSRPRVS
ncbi:pyridoxal phosphate-dependent decarboxylase family protein [Halostreptopolyspora alba]|uniref:Pyridoxal-dependent decarboxylase n=1 Tax=Halostreptopolyspora alba TaxID=2487137 RepID=A0A3N0EGG2_9ACTN|nr:pyridoxal-dependent decarboxylase [Nocardiopsaceae bacterium YIM 96095]